MPGTGHWLKVLCAVVKDVDTVIDLDSFKPVIDIRACGQITVAGYFGGRLLEFLVFIDKGFKAELVVVPGCNE